MRGNGNTRSGRRKFIKGVTALGACTITRQILGMNVLSAHAAAFDLHSRTFPEPDSSNDDPFPHHVFLPLVSAGQTPQECHGPSKLGLHTINSIGAVDFVQGVQENGAHVAIVKAVNEFGFLRLVKGYSPETLTIGRSTAVQGVSAQGDPAQTAESVMNEHMPRWSYEKDVVDYWEVLNENDPPTVEGHAWLAQFYIEAMAIAEENDYKLIVAEKQNYYPDISFVSRGEQYKFAVDLKTTYRDPE